MIRLSCALLSLAFAAVSSRAAEIFIAASAHDAVPPLTAGPLTALPVAMAPTALAAGAAASLSPAAALGLFSSAPGPLFTMIAAAAELPALSAPSAPQAAAASAPGADRVPARVPALAAAADQLGTLSAANAARSDGRKIFDGGLPAAQAPADAVPARAEKLSFTGVGARDVYNLTAPFKVRFRGREREVLAGRVERRDSEESEAFFFEKSGDDWRPLAGAPVWKLQDPFFTKVGGELICGGVETFPQADGGTGYRTVFYRGKDLSGMKVFAHGPDGMKDIRLVQMPNGKIVVLTRPQGAIGGKGKIAVTTIHDLDSLGPDAINNAVVLEGLFSPEEWGGANELHVLKDGRIGVLGHVASFDAAGNRHYSPMAFILDPATGLRSPMKVLLRRSELPPGASKRPDLADVLFSGGLVRGENGTAVLYVGAGDAEAYRVIVADPFFEPASAAGRKRD